MLVTFQNSLKFFWGITGKPRKLRTFICIIPALRLTFTARKINISYKKYRKSSDSSCCSSRTFRIYTAFSPQYGPYIKPGFTF